MHPGAWRHAWNLVNTCLSFILIYRKDVHIKPLNSYMTPPAHSHTKSGFELHMCLFTPRLPRFQPGGLCKQGLFIPSRVICVQAASKKQMATEKGSREAERMALLLALLSWSKETGILGANLVCWAAVWTLTTGPDPPPKLRAAASTPATSAGFLQLSPGQFSLNANY